MSRRKTRPHAKDDRRRADPSRLRVSSAGRQTRRRIRICAAILVLAGALAYWSGLASPFMFDDQTSIENNRQIRQLTPLSVPLSPPRDTPVAGRPLANLSLALNVAAGGLDPTGFRAINLAIHLLAGLALFGVVRRALILPRLAATFGAHATAIAWACALLWTLHPLQTEVVNYISERTESLMGLCFLLTLYGALRALGAGGADPGRSAGRWTFTAIGACAAGMACKESMVTAPVIVLLFDRLFVFDSWRQALAVRRRLYAGLAATWLVLAALLWSVPRTSAGFGSGVSPWVYLLNQARMIVRYLELSAWPRALVLDYGLPESLTLGDVVVPGAVVAALLLATVVSLVYRPAIGFLGAWFFITLAPTSSFVPIATEVGAERRMYLPLAAIVVLVVCGLYSLFARRQAASDGAGVSNRASRLAPVVAYAALGIACAFMIAGIVLRSREYSSTLTMAQTIVERWPSGRGHYLLGTELVTAGRHDEGMVELRASARDYPGALFALGTELVASGSVEEGIQTLQAFIRALPMHFMVIPAHELLGRAYASEGNLDAAGREFELLLQMAPNHAVARDLLSRIRAAQAGPGFRTR